MGGIKSTLDNAKEAWQGEKDEYNDMYPMFMDQAKRDKNNEALTSFFWANEAEKVHANFYERAVNSLQEGNDLELKDVYVCSVCGYTVEGAPPDKCPVCGKEKKYFGPIK